MRIKYNGTINASSDKDYASLKGTDFDKAKAVLTKDGYKEHEYGDKDDNNGYAVYRKGDKEVELTYEWIKGKRNGEAHAGKVLDVYVDDNINGACGGKRKSVKASRRAAIKAGYWDSKQGDNGREYTYDVDPNSLFMGLQGAYFIWLNNVADPWVEYNGNLYNANEVTDYLWEEYNEICQEEGMEATEDGFDAWIEPDFVESALMDSIPMAKVDFTSGNYRKAIGASVKASRRAIMAGPGAGYTIKWNLESINSINSFNVTSVSEPDQYGLITAEADCDVDVTVEIVEAYSYYYGIDSPLNDVPAKMTKVKFEIDPGLWPEIGSLYDADVAFAEELLNNEIYDVVSNGEVMYGGGWTHSTWDGTLTDYDHDDLIEVKVTDEEVIQYVDDAVNGAFESDYDDTEDFDSEEY